MAALDPTLLWYLVPSGGLIASYLALHGRTERGNAARRAAIIEAGLHEPVSLHPRIDPVACIGCGSCVSACPEGDVLGLIHGKAELIAASECVGHGACSAACPSDAIELVFGTEKRGVDLPHVQPDFQTNVPGLYIAGELGGMGLIRNAIEQGRQAIDNIAASECIVGAQHDVIIAGAGPAGIAASLAAKARKLNYLTLEQDSLGGTVAHFPRGKLVMTAPATLPLYGRIKFNEIGKEELLRFWTGIAQDHRLNIAFGERIEAIEQKDGRFVVRTSSRRLSARAVLLAIGRRGTPRRLDVPGEDLPKVVYRLIEPEQYRGKRVLVVGGGDSALEAAAILAEETDATVTLCYRGEGFSRAKPKNRDRIATASAGRHLAIHLRTEAVSITPEAVVLKSGDRQWVSENDAVIICAGGVLPTDFLRHAGIRVETKFGTA